MSPRYPTPPLRVTPLNQGMINTSGDYVLYWMVAQRRLSWNFALQRAVERCLELNKPLLIFEPLRIGYQWASERLHHFIIEGMRDNLAIAADHRVTYFPYVEPEPNAGKGLLKQLCDQACLVVTDDFPCYFIPRMTQAAAARSPLLFEQVDSCGISPLRASGRHFTTAASFRRHLHKTILNFVTSDQFPHASPLEDHELQGVLSGAVIPAQVTERWTPANPASLLNGGLSSLMIDHEVQPVERGGAVAANEMLTDFIEHKLDRYHLQRNALSESSVSGLSPHLHFGHISSHQIVQSALEQSDWSPERVAPKPTGSREGWWGASTAVEAFIDQMITWRELGFVFTHHHPTSYDHYESLPSWALTTLAEHADDPRPHVYTLEELERGLTHEPLWNAAQRQLVTEGKIHNYVRMLWGKKILEWSPTPREALTRLIHLNNKYAIDGRDPNSYSGIFWCLGRFDRAWGPERPIFGKVRFMSAASTMRKLKARDYVARYLTQTTAQMNLF